MAETLLQFKTPIAAPDGSLYRARACGTSTESGLWEGWIEFDALDGTAGVATLRSPRETTQPNRRDAEYWATGLTPVYLEGALSRATDPVVVAPARPPEPPVFDGPAPSAPTAPMERVGAPAILDPFSVYEKGEALLRRQLNALSAWHLVNIIVEYELSDDDRALLNRQPASSLIEVIVAEVQAQVADGA